MPERFDFQFTPQHPSRDEVHRDRLKKYIADLKAELEAVRQQGSEAHQRTNQQIASADKGFSLLLAAGSPTDKADPVAQLERTLSEYEAVLADVERNIVNRKLASLNLQMSQLEIDLDVLKKAIESNTAELSKLREQGPVDTKQIDPLRQKALKFSSDRESLLTKMKECDRERAKLLLLKPSDQG
jgi:chromosome segregation ATPase